MKDPGWYRHILDSVLADILAYNSFSDRTLVIDSLKEKESPVSNTRPASPIIFGDAPMLDVMTGIPNDKDFKMVLPNVSGHLIE